MEIKQSKMCEPPCDTCGGTMTEEECKEMASHHSGANIIMTIMILGGIGGLVYGLIKFLINL